MIIKRKIQQTALALLSIASLAICSQAVSAEETATRGGMDIVQSKAIPVPVAGALDVMQQALDKYNAGDNNGALVAINEVLLRDPFNPQAFFFRGLIRERQGDYINAISDFDQNRVAALDAAILGEKGSCQCHLADFKASLNSYNRALDLRPGKDAGAQLLARRASVKRILHDDNGAVDDCSTSLRLMPNNPDGLWQRALTYIDLKQLDAAVPDLQKLVQQQPRFANGHYTLAECYMSLGRAKDAQTEYQRAVDLFAVQHDEQGRKMAMQRLAQIPDASTQQ